MAEPELLSRKIMERLRAEAADAPRGARRLGTLRRLEEACDDIVSGRARALATKADEDGLEFGTARRPRLSTMAIGRYVDVRALLDRRARVENSEWTGPHPSTIRGDQDLLSYLRAREKEAHGLKKSRPSNNKTARIDDMIVTIPREEDRSTVQHAVEGLRRDSFRYKRLVAALGHIPGIDLSALLQQDPTNGPVRAEATTIEPLGPGERIILRRLLDRLDDPSILREFALKNDGRRVTMSYAPATRLVEMDELDLLRSLAGKSGARAD